jgi:broad specificity phosphatase PhoE
VAGFADELAARCREMEAERAGEIAVVAHGGTLRMLNAYLRGIPVERMRWEPLSNGCILRSPEGWPAVWPTPQHESR